MILRALPIGIRPAAALTLLLLWGLMGRSGSSQTTVEDKDKTSAAEIKKLIEQLGSSQFSDRETASKRIQEIGKPALSELRKVAADSKDSEIRRRAKELIQKISPESSEAPWETLLKQGILEETSNKDFNKAADILTKAGNMAEKNLRANPNLPNQADIPILTEINLHLARCYRELKEWQKAGNAYNSATCYSNYNREKRKQIDREWSEMADRLLSRWEKTVKEKIGNNAELKKLIAEYPLVVLHSRRFAGGSYLKSAYSFKYQSVEENKHRNDVQLLFDNGPGEKTFQVNMVVGQKNLIRDLGSIDFAKEPDPNQFAAKEEKSWQKDSCKAIEGHTYLEKVEDDRENKFFVVFQILAVDNDSNFLAFVWRRLPGGKITKDR